MRKERSMLDARTEEQRDQQKRVQNFGGGEDFLDKYFKFECMNLALEAVADVTELLSGEHESDSEAVGMDTQTREKVSQAILKSLEGKLATESVPEDMATEIITAVESVGSEEGEVEELTPWDIINNIACESVGIGEGKPTADQKEDYRNVLSQMTHAFGYLSGNEKVAEMALESVNSEDDDQLARVMSTLNDEITIKGVDDHEIALEYVMDAPIICDLDEDGDIAIEKVQIKFVGGKKKKVKKRLKKIRGAALANLKKSGRKAGKLKKSAATKKLMVKSLKKRKKAGY